MSGNIRLPNITGDTADAKISALQSYMYQLVEQLNFVLSTVEEAEEGELQNVVINGENGTKKEISQATFDELKSLIIDSADIVNAYYEKITQKFNSIYLSGSDFGKYAEQVEQSITYSSSGIAQMFDNYQLLQSEIGAIRSQLVDTNAWINSGLLESKEDGTPIYGVEVGQKTVNESGEEMFNKFARFTSEGVYFYTPNMSVPVAYMTDTKLYITNAQVTGSLNLGEYIMDTSFGLSFIWIGVTEDG